MPDRHHSLHRLDLGHMQSSLVPGVHHHFLPHLLSRAADMGSQDWSSPRSHLTAAAWNTGDSPLVLAQAHPTPPTARQAKFRRQLSMPRFRGVLDPWAPLAAVILRMVKSGKLA